MVEILKLVHGANKSIIDKVIIFVPHLKIVTKAL